MKCLRGQTTAAHGVKEVCQKEFSDILCLNAIEECEVGELARKTDD